MGKDIDYNELFGLDEAGAEGAEVAEPSEEVSVEGEEAEEVAVPPDGGNPEPGADDGAGDDNGTGEGGQQSPQERAQFAAARRKAEAERDASVAKAKQEAAQNALKYIDEAIASMNMTNPYTKQPIKTKADFDAFNAQRGEEQRKDLLKRSGMNEAQYAEFVAGLPEVKAANEAKAQAEKEQQAAREQQARANLEEQVKLIGKLDPKIKTLQDVTQSENYPEVYKLVQKGYSLEHAYKIANFDSLNQHTAAAVKQQTLNAAQGKGHMKPTASRGAGGVTVPADVAEQYRLFNPGITDAEIQKHYARYHKK